MALPLANTLEGGTNTTAISNANSGGVSGNAFDAVVGTAPTFSSTHAAHGALGFSPATTAQSMVTWTTSIGSPTEMWFRTYFFLTGNASANVPIIYYRDQTNTNNICGLRIDTGATTMSITANGSTAVASVGATIPTNQWVRIELHGIISGANATTDCQYFASPDAVVPTATQTITAATAATSFTAIRVGNNLTQTTTFWFDDLLLNSTGWPGPSAPRAALTRSFIPQIAASTR